MQKFVGSFLSTVMERRCLWGALQMEVLGSFQIKSSKTSKAFFQPTYEIDFISYDVLSEEVPEAAFILYNEMLAPYLPEKITKVGQPIAYVDIATKIMNSLKSFGC